MSGLLALLDDVAGIAKVAAASVDDVAAQALKAGTKAAGAVIEAPMQEAVRAVEERVQLALATG